VLNLHVPDIPGGPDQGARLWDALRDQSPELFSYALSFAVLGRYWVVHHRMFRHVRTSDSALLVINLAFLALIALVPFPTEILGRYGDTTTAVALYAFALMLTGIGSAALTIHVGRAQLLDERVSDQYKQHSIVRAVTLPLVFAISIPIAFVDPSAAEISWGVSAVVLHVIGTRRYGNINQPFTT
jgi:uncharacterized membrane protein